MKTSQDRQQQIRRERVEALIDGRIAALFGRLPMLCGFALEADLQLAEVSVHSWPGYIAGEDLYDEIMTATPWSCCAAGRSRARSSDRVD